MSLLALFFALLSRHFFTDESLAGYVPNDTIWVLAEMDALPVQPRITLRFAHGQDAYGQAPCNSYRATLAAPYPWFALGPILSTKRACPDLALENRYFTTLQTMSLAEVSGPVLLLSNDTGDTLVFQAAN